MKKTLRFLAILTMLVSPSSAQDFHLSQFDAAALYHNPAMTASYFNTKGDYKMYADYRSQWSSVSGDPFTTSYISFDMPHKRFGMGGYMINNHAGGFNTFNILASFSYRITTDLNHTLMVGTQAGILNKSFNPNSFTYDSQYDPATLSGFDTGLSSGETFSRTNLLNFDANIGLYYKYTAPKQPVNPFAGFAVYHVTMPNESFTSMASKLPMRFVIYGGTDIEAHERMKITPSVLYMNQAGAHELTAGALGAYRIAPSDFELLFGMHYRFDDAVIVQFGIKRRGHAFRFSYDIQASDVSKIAGSREAIEFSLVLTGIRGRSLFNF